MIAHAVLQQRHLAHAVEFRHADAAAEFLDRLGRIPPAAQAGEGRHARIVPAADVSFGDEREQLAFAHDRVVEVEPGELDLLRMVDGRIDALVERVDEPVVERAVVLELQRADRVRDALDRVLQPVGPVVRGVDAPFVAGAVVCGVQDAIHDRVAQVEVGRGHVDLGPQRARAVGKLAFAHAVEQVEVFRGIAIAVRAVPAVRGERAAVLADLVRRQVADVRFAALDQRDRPLVQLLEIVAGEQQPVFVIGSEPADVLDDRIDVFLLFLDRVRVIEAQVELPAVLLGQPVVEQDALGVSDVQIPVGLGRKAYVCDLTPDEVRELRGIAIAVRAVPAVRGERAAVLADLVRRQVADVRFAALDQRDRPLVQLLEIVAGEQQPVFVIGSEPADVLDDRIDVFLLFLDRVRVIEAQVELPAVLLGQPVVEQDALGVSDVQIPVGLGRKARVHAPAPFPAAQVVLDDLLDEV